MWVWMFTRSLKNLLPEKDKELRIDFCAGREVGLLRMSLREVLPQLRTNESAQFPVELWIELNQHKNNLVMRRNEAADVQIGLRDTWGYYFQCLLTSPTAHKTPIAATAAPKTHFSIFLFHKDLEPIDCDLIKFCLSQPTWIPSNWNGCLQKIGKQKNYNKRFFETGIRLTESTISYFQLQKHILGISFFESLRVYIHETMFNTILFLKI